MTNSKKHLFILGFMATGKSTLGKKAAKRIQLPFLDLDHCIEELARQSISEIFAAHGEQHFRSTESTVLQNLALQAPSLIATGGGTPCHNNNMDFILQNGWSIYLQTPPERLLGRLRQQRSQRPLLAQLSDAELKGFIDKKLEERNPFYEQADFVIVNNGKKVRELVEEVEAIFAETIQPTL